MSRVMVVGALMALAGCSGSPQEGAALAAGLQSMSQAHYAAAGAYQPPATTTCRPMPGPNLGSAPRGVTCY